MKIYEENVHTFSLKLIFLKIGFFFPEGIILYFGVKGDLDIFIIF